MERDGDGRGRRRGGVGEVRRIQILYYLSRDGRMEQPHLIRVHYHYINGGVRLRDVKGWLSKIRGKDMPESFSWAYKRKYRSGYVWQDIVEDDLITAIVDNEYVLKGSLISSSSEEIVTKMDADDEEKQKKEINLPVMSIDGFKCNNAPQDTVEEDDASSKSPPPLHADEEDDDDSPGLSTTTTNSSSCCVDASTQTPTTKTTVFNIDEKCRRRSLKWIFDKEGEEKWGRIWMESKVQTGNRTNVNPSLSVRKSKSSRDGNHGTEEIKKFVKEKESQEEDNKRASETRIGNRNKDNSYLLGKGTSNQGRRRGITEHVFRNLIICGGAETQESAVMSINSRRDGGDRKSARIGGLGYGCIQQSPPPHTIAGKRVPLVGEFGKCEVEDLLQLQSQCLQCGKAFKPKMLHEHMMFCKALKAKVRASSRSENSASRQGNNLSKDAVSTFLSVY